MGLKETSKFISLILRHKPETIGISLDEHGWADVQEMIRGINAAGNHHLSGTCLRKSFGQMKSSDTLSMRTIR